MTMFPETERAAARNGKCDDCLDEQSLFVELNTRLARVEANQRATSIAISRVDYQTVIILGVLAVVLWKVRNGIA